MISIPICLVCGTFGNIVSFIVYVRKWSKFTIPLVFLSCFDLILLWTDSVFSGSWAYFRHLMETRLYGCAISSYLYMASFFASIFIVAMFTVLRSYSVVRPLKFAPIFTSKRVLCIAFTLTLIAFIMECPWLLGFSSAPQNNTTVMYRFIACGFRSDYYTFYFNFWLYVETIVIVASLGAIVIGNIVVIINLIRRKPTNSNTTIDTSQISHRLIAISVGQVLLWMPWIVLSAIATGIMGDIGSYEHSLLMVVLELALTPLRIQSGFGFLVYTCIGSEFRAVFLQTAAKLVRYNARTAEVII